jgi:hypothetical protein
VKAMERGGNKIINAIFEAHQSPGAKPHEDSEMIDRLTFCQLKYEQKVYFSPTAAQRLVRLTSPVPQPAVCERLSSENDATQFTSSAKPRTPRRSSLPMILVPFSSPKTTTCSKASFNDSIASSNDSGFETEATSSWWEIDTSTSISTLSHSVSIISPSSSFGKIKVGDGSRWRKRNHAKRRSTGSDRLKVPSIDDRHLEDEQHAKESSTRSSTASPSESRRASIGSSTTSHQGTEEYKSKPVIYRSRHTRRASIGSSTTSQQDTHRSRGSPVSMYGFRLDGVYSDQSIKRDTCKEEKMESTAPRKSRAARRNSLTESSPRVMERPKFDRRSTERSMFDGHGSSPSEAEPIVFRSRDARQASIGSSTTTHQGTEESKSKPAIYRSRHTRRASVGSSTSSQQDTHRSGGSPVSIYGSRLDGLYSDQSIKRDTCKDENIESTDPRKSRAARRNSLTESSPRVERPKFDRRSTERSMFDGHGSSPSESEPVVFRSRDVRRASLDSSATSQQGTAESKFKLFSRRASVGSSTSSPQGTHNSGASPVSLYGSRLDRLSNNRSIKRVTSTSEEKMMESTAPPKSRAARRNSKTGTFEEEKMESTAPRKSRAARRNSKTDTCEEENMEITAPQKSRATRRNSKTDTCEEENMESTAPQKSRTARRNSLTGSSPRDVERPKFESTKFDRRSTGRSMFDGNSGHSSRRATKLDTCEEEQKENATSRNSRCTRRRQDSARSIRAEDSKEDEVGFVSPRAGRFNERQGLIVPRGSGDKSRSAAFYRSIEAVRKSLGDGVGSASGKKTSSRRSSVPSNMPINIDGEEQLLEADRPRRQPRRNSMFTESTDNETILDKTVAPPLPTSTRPMRLPPSLHVLLCKGNDDEKTLISNVTTDSSIESSWSLAKARWTA